MDSLDVAFVDDDRHQEHRKLRRLGSDNAVVFCRHQLLALFDSHQIRLAMERERNRRFTDLMRKEERKEKRNIFCVISVGLFIGLLSSREVKCCTNVFGRAKRIRGNFVEKLRKFRRFSFVNSLVVVT